MPNGTCVATSVGARQNLSSSGAAAPNTLKERKWGRASACVRSTMLAQQKTCLDRTEGVTLLQLTDTNYRIAKTLCTLCINSTRIFFEHAAFPSPFKPRWGHPSGRLPSAYAGVVALKQLHFTNSTISPCEDVSGIDCSSESSSSSSARLRRTRAPKATHVSAG